MLKVITGLGRSGTSCLAGYCKMLGYDMGDMWFNDINAGYESTESISINQDIKCAIENGMWSSSVFKDRISSIKGPIIKDPRFTWDIPCLIETWMHARSIKFVVSSRDHSSVVSSKVACNATSLRSIEECDNTFSNFINRLDDCGVDYNVLIFPDYLYDHDSVCDALEIEGDLDIWNSWVDFEKVHY